MQLHKRIIAWALLLCLAGVAQAQVTSSCGSLANHYGPFDYRTANKQQKSIVENAHFTPSIENLIKDHDNPFANDISYTLRVFPNHHRALITMQRLADRENTDKPDKAQWSMACYYERAIRYQPDDTLVRMLFAVYLHKRSQPEQATHQLNEVIRLADDNPFTHFNAGLIFFDMKNFDRALIQAHRAAELGFTRTELKDRLVAVGKWAEPPPPLPPKAP